VLINPSRKLARELVINGEGARSIVSNKIQIIAHKIEPVREKL